MGLTFIAVDPVVANYLQALQDDWHPFFRKSAEYVILSDDKNTWDIFTAARSTLLPGGTYHIKEIEKEIGKAISRYFTKIPMG